MLVVLNPSNPVHTVFTVTGASTARLNSTCTVQFRVTADPIGRTGLRALLDNITEVGGGIYIQLIDLDQFVQLNMTIANFEYGYLEIPSL